MMMNREKKKSRERERRRRRAFIRMKQKKKYVCELVLFFDAPMPCFHLTMYVTLN